MKLLHSLENAVPSTLAKGVLALALATVLAGCETTGGKIDGNVLADSLRTLASVGQASWAVNTANPRQNETLNLIQMLAQAVDQIDEPREIEIGRNLSAVLLGSKPAHPDARLQQYVNELGRWISLHSSRPQLPWVFVVLNDPGFNAFAAPGGYVFVTKGLVDRAATEAELAGVLAHEIVHVESRHHLKALNKAARAGLLAQVVGSQLNKEVNAQVADRLMNLGKNLYSKGLDREDELEADRRGVELAARAGLDPYGLPSLLQTLASARPDDPSYLLALATHPPTEQRLAALQNAMGTRLDRFSNQRPVTVAQRLQPNRAAPAASAPAAPKAPATPAAPARKPGS
jgi:predicted Zn-dependent protease